ncbi:antA/AntB antirepressor family protein [Shewanella marina]|uniref:antA/AntB antirepressor family protein n=1 Tax=Shewanella marina TaxID=487319 RepID=UPI000471BB0A|nr:antA/AntB antirepressor family protein [Shewanella marina]
MTNDLITIHSRTLYGTQAECVKARDLHRFLKIGRDFSTWIKARIDQYGFEYNTDYVAVENLSSPKRGSTKSRTQTRTEYYISLDMAKELAMVERNEKGREARRYFIDCEKQLREQQSLTANTNSLTQFFDFAKIVLTIENGQVTHCHHLPNNAFMTTRENLVRYINEPAFLSLEQVAEIAAQANDKLARYAKRVQQQR